MDEWMKEEAKRIILEEKAACVVAFQGEILYLGQGNGIFPLMEYFDREELHREGMAIFDKVIGKAAASFVVSLKPGYVFARTISDAGYRMLTTHGIKTEYDKKVPVILNRTQDGMCMLEQKVQSIDKVAECVAVLKDWREGIRRQKLPRAAQG